MLRSVRRDDGRWFMDYRNGDGSVGEMCGNGIRVFARYLHEREGEAFPMQVETRSGLKTLERSGDEFTADMGAPAVFGETTVSVESAPGRPATSRWATRTPSRSSTTWPRPDTSSRRPVATWPSSPMASTSSSSYAAGEHHVAMRVHERGAGETRSCGTGACAVAVVASLADDAPRGTPTASTYPAAPSPSSGPRTTAC